MPKGLKQRIAEILYLSVPSQLFLLKHKEVKDVIKEMDNLSDKILQEFLKVLPEEKKIIQHYDDLDNGYDTGWNTCLSDIRKELI